MMNKPIDRINYATYQSICMELCIPTLPELEPYFHKYGTFLISLQDALPNYDTKSSKFNDYMLKIAHDVDFNNKIENL